jgi:Flp pilus assembly pilin Flp
MQSINDLTLRTAVAVQNFVHDAAERLKDDEEGQTAVEYAGIIALIAVIFALLFAVNIPQKIKDAVGPAVDDILKGKE